MATSSAFSTTNIYIKYTISIIQNSQSVENNTSNVTVRVRFYRTNTGYETWGTGTLYVYINGTTYEEAVTTSDVVDENGIVLFSKTLNINHKADGSKKLSTSAYIEHSMFSSSSNAYSQTLTTIPRQATLKTATNFNDEQNPIITYSNPAETAVTSLQARIYWDDDSGISYRDISKTGSSYTFNLTSDERTALQKATTSNSRKVKFRIRTGIGGAYYYSTLERTFSIVNANPIVTGSVVDTNETTIALTGDSSKLVRYYSNAKATMSAESQKGASINPDMYVIRNGGKTGYGTTYTFNNVESNEFIFSAEDSRENIGRATVKADMVDYVKLTCNLSDNRPNAAGNMTVSCSGNYFNGSFGAVSNTLTVQYRYRKHGGVFGGWVDMTATKNNNSYYASASLTGLDYQETYYFETRAIDKLDTISSEESPVKSMPVFHWGENDFVFEVPVQFNNGLTISGDYLFNGNPLNDVVISQGTSGIWTYRKWASGRAECWGTNTVNVSYTAASGASSFYQATIPSVNFPSGLFASAPVVTVTPQRSSTYGFWIMSTGASGTSTSASGTGTFTAVRWSAQSNTPATVLYVAHGRWA